MIIIQKHTILAFFFALVLVLMSGCVEEIGVVEPEGLQFGEGGSLFKSGEIQYEAKRLGRLGGAESSLAFAISNNGQVVGGSGGYAFIWQNFENGMEQLASPDHPDNDRNTEYCFALDNSDAVIVGFCAEYVSTFDGFPVRWFAGNPEALPLDNVYEYETLSGSANSVNDNGSIAGRVYVALDGYDKDNPRHSDVRSHAVVWTDDNMNILSQELEDYTSSSAHAINNSGFVAGIISTTESNVVIWPGIDNPPVKLNLPVGSSMVQVNSLNNDGDVVGQVSLDSGESYAVVWFYEDNGNWGEPIQLGAGIPPGPTINDRQNDGVVQIAGRVSGRNSGNRAIIWTVSSSTGAIDMQELPMPSDLHHRWGSVHSVTGINSEGWIVGVTQNRHHSDTEATLWRPVEDDEGPGDPDPNGEITVASITYSTHGGPNNNRHLQVSVHLEDADNNPAAGVSVSIDLFRDGNFYASGTSSSGSDGAAVFSFNNAPDGCYVTVVTEVGGEWDGEIPDNENCK